MVTFFTTIKERKGFTLVEMLVSFAIFSVVMIATTSAVLTIIDVNRKARATQLIMDNLNFALEDMLRNIRVGSAYDYSGSFSENACATGRIFSFVSFDGSTTFRFRCSEGRIYGDKGLGFLPVTASEIDVQTLRFDTVGDSNNQPGVFIVISGVANVTNEISSAFNLQTFVSQRNMEL